MPPVINSDYFGNSDGSMTRVKGALGSGMPSLPCDSGQPFLIPFVTCGCQYLCAQSAGLHHFLQEIKVSGNAEGREGAGLHCK